MTRPFDDHPELGVVGGHIGYSSWRQGSSAADDRR